MRRKATPIRRPAARKARRAPAKRPGISGKARAAWAADVLGPALAQTPERQEEFRTASGIPVERVYTSDDAARSGGEVGFPGAYPFTRGVYPTMYRGRLWTMRQYGGYAGAEES